MARLRFDDNGYRLQVFTPSENKLNVTTLNVKNENILAIMLPAATSVQINGTGAAANWPPGVYAMHPDVNTLTFGTAATVICMK